MAKVPTQIYSRVAGYFAMVFHGEKSGNWNRGKTEEFKERVVYKIPEEFLTPEKELPEVRINPVIPAQIAQ
jgi:hypothetical protein